MGSHLVDGQFQSDKYPTTPRGKVPLSCADPTAQDLLWEYAQRRRRVDAQFADDLERALVLAGYAPNGAAETLLKAQEVACLCQVDLKTVHNWVDGGKLGAFRTPGRHLRFKRLEVVEFLQRYGYPVPTTLLRPAP